MRALTASTLWRAVPDPAHFFRMESGVGLDGDEVALRTTATYTPKGQTQKRVR